MVQNTMHMIVRLRNKAVCEVVSERRMNNWLGMFVTDLGNNRV